ncbi:MAG: hypothetical protein WAL47_05310 [Pyrinomonadaceae bacterium]
MKGKGAPGIIVGLRAADDFNRQTSVSKSTTDHEGIYRLTNVPPGTYQVIPYAPTFVVSGDRGRTLIIGAGETVEGIDFTLTRGGVITGRATDSEGRPLIEEQITLLPVEGNNQDAQSYIRHLNTMTDDRGIYRIFGVAQGNYRVRLGRGDDGFVGAGPRTSPYKQTFHPAVTEISQAAVIAVSEGSEATNIDITVGRTLATFTASGRIVDGANGKPLPNMRYGVQMFGTDQGSSFVNEGFVANGQGEFKLENLTPGKYAFFIVPQADNGMRADPVSFDLIDQDVTGLLLKTSPGASVSGVVLLEGTDDKTLIARLSQVLIHAQVAREGPSDIWHRPVTTSHDGSFRIGGLRGGTAQFSLNSIGGGPPRGFTLIRVERDGIVQPRGLEIKEGEEVTGVRLVVAYGNGTIRGLVKLENGELPLTAQFAVWLSNAGDDTLSVQRTSLSPPVDSRGHFLFEGLAPGLYEVHAGMYTPGSRTRPPSARRQVNVADGVVTEVTLTLTLEPNPNLGNP